MKILDGDTGDRHPEPDEGVDHLLRHLPQGLPHGLHGHDGGGQCGQHRAGCCQLSPSLTIKGRVGQKQCFGSRNLTLYEMYLDLLVKHVLYKVLPIVQDAGFFCFSLIMT